MKPFSKALAPVGKAVGGISDTVGSITGPLAMAANIGTLFFPPLAPVAAGLDAVSMGAGIASSASKVVDGDPNTNLGIGDVFSALPMLNMFP